MPQPPCLLPPAARAITGTPLSPLLLAHTTHLCRHDAGTPSTPASAAMADRRQWQQLLSDLEKLLRTRLAQADDDSARAVLQQLYHLAPDDLTSKPDQAQAKQLAR